MALEFTRTISIASFKRERNVNRIAIIRNPNTGKLFFESPDDSDVSGKVSKAFDANEDNVMSLCTDDTDGEQFWMLHKEGSNEDNVVATL